VDCEITLCVGRRAVMRRLPHLPPALEQDEAAGRLGVDADDRPKLPRMSAEEPAGLAESRSLVARSASRVTVLTVADPAFWCLCRAWLPTNGVVLPRLAPGSQV